MSGGAEGERMSKGSQATGVRPNAVKRAIAKGGRALGTMVFEFFTPGIAQICKVAGADFVLYDMEHSGMSIETLKAQVAYCRGVGIDPFVRVPATEYHLIARALDTGATGIMVPMVETAEQARTIVSCTRYPPAGRRGAAFGMAHDDYEGGPVVEKMRAADERTLVICLIETPRGVENVDAIAAETGVDVCWLGHFDLTNFMGLPGEFRHPRFFAAVDDLVAACARHGKTPGFMAMDEAWAREFMDRGFRLLAYGLDIALMQRELARGLEGMRHHRP
jgi:2-dehydro-3-deoxyglucarate aldolase/4-hydroxy-2-oxoheptanedioate aldolase